MVTHRPSATLSDFTPFLEGAKPSTSGSMLFVCLCVHVDSPFALSSGSSCLLYNHGCSCSLRGFVMGLNNKEVWCFIFMTFLGEGGVIEPLFNAYLINIYKY